MKSAAVQLCVRGKLLVNLSAVVKRVLTYNCHLVGGLFTVARIITYTQKKSNISVIY